MRGGDRVAAAAYPPGQEGFRLTVGLTQGHGETCIKEVMGSIFILLLTTFAEAGKVLRSRMDLYRVIELE